MKQRGNRWHHEACIDAQTVVQLYLQGLSTRQVSEQVGYSATYVHQVCQDAGITRDRITALRLRQRPTSQHWRAARQAARRAVARFLGRSLSSREHVHHRDGDFTNNSLENLEILTPRAHAHHHHPPNPIPRSQRPARRAYNRRYYQTCRVPVTCVECGQPYTRYKYSLSRTCSRRCGAIRAWRSRSASITP